MSDNARIDIRGKSVDLPIVEGSEGELGLDISKLRAQSKTITLDPGDFGTSSFDAEHLQLSLQLGQPNCSQPLLESNQILWLYNKRRLLC